MAVYTLKLPYQRPPRSLHGNTRSHWRARAADTRNVRETVMSLARQAGIPKCDRMTVQLVWAPGDRRRRDEDNLYAGFLKSLCDGLARGPRRDWVGLDLVPDDTREFMDKSAVILSPDECDEVGMWLVVTTHGEAAA